MPEDKNYDIVSPQATADSLGWELMGSALSPFIGIRFRSGYTIVYPNKENLVYIENAEFNVTDFSATITLADPDFINLEHLFLTATWELTSRNNDEFWFCACYWGWQFYGRPVKNDWQNSKEPVYQNKSSGWHYFMIKDLKYDIDDVELRVTFTLIDVSKKVLDSGEHGPRVGIVSGLLEELKTEVSRSEEVQTGGYDYFGGTELPLSQSRRNQLVDIAQGRASPDDPPTSQKDLEQDGLNEDGSMKSAEQKAAEEPKETEDGERPTMNNVFWRAGYNQGYTHWEVIQRLLDSHNIRYVAINTFDNSENPLKETPLSEPIIIPENRGLYSAVKDLCKNVPQRIKTGDDGSEVQEYWDIMPGTWVDEDGKGRIVFGYRAGQPTREQAGAWSKLNFPIVRNWTYRPRDKNALRSGVGMVKSFSFSWDVQGPWGIAAPTLYAAVKDNKTGEYKLYFTKTEAEEAVEIAKEENYWSSYEEKARKQYGLAPKSNEPPKKSKEIYVFGEQPEITGAPLTDAIKELRGVELQFNFEQRTDTGEVIEQRANTLIINMWNFFLSYVIEVDIEIFGDPWLDNTMFDTTRNVSRSVQGNITRLLINLFQSQFRIKVYRADGAISTMLSGRYVCLGGTVVHKISEGEYSTSLRLSKIPNKPGELLI